MEVNESGHTGAVRAVAVNRPHHRTAEMQHVPFHRPAVTAVPVRRAWHLCPGLQAINMATELLIENVYLYPVLYQLDHREYKNIKKKDRIWEVIAKELNEPSDALKKKWKNLRDSYMKYFTANKCTTGQEKKPYVAWKWSAQMERFRPFVTNAKTETNVSLKSKTDVETPPQEGIDEPTIDQPEEEQGAEDDPGQEAHENAVHVVSSDNANLRSRKRKLATETNTDKVIQYFKSKSRTDMDELDHVMIGFAKTIKKLSRKRQIIAKKRIAEIITELELEELDDCSSAYSPRTSAGSRSDMVSPSTSTLSNTRFSINQDTDSHGPLMVFQPLTEPDVDCYGDEDCSMTVFNSFQKL